MAQRLFHGEAGIESSALLDCCFQDYVIAVLFASILELNREKEGPQTVLKKGAAWNQFTARAMTSWYLLFTSHHHVLPSHISRSYAQPRCFKPFLLESIASGTERLFPDTLNTKGSRNCY